MHSDIHSVNNYINPWIFVGNSLINFCFCRSGQVSVQLRNRGSDAFKHSEYGDSIIIERRITADGGSSYKLKSRKGKFIFFNVLNKGLKTVML